MTGIILALFAGLAFSAGGPREALWKYARVPAVPDAGNAIFVGIASYCDKELDLTLTQLFGRAKLPQRVYVGLVLQEHKAIRDGAELSRWRSHPNVRMIEFEPKESKGAGWARTQIANMHRGEAYYLQLDSHHLLHSRVGRGVRRPPLQARARLSQAHAHILRAQLPGERHRGGRSREAASWRMTAGHWMKPFSGLTPKKIQYLPAPVEAHMKTNDGKSQVSAFFSAHFVFVRSEWLREVPYDPEMYFDGEEDSLGIRSWTSGWDMFYPSMHIVFHRYERKNQTKHWDDHPEIFHNMTISSIKRLDDIIATWGGPKGSDALGKYGLGKVRSIEQYQHCGRGLHQDVAEHARGMRGRSAKMPANSVPKLWVHKEGHFQMHKYEKWGGSVGGVEAQGRDRWAGEGRTAGGDAVVRREPLDRDTAGHQPAATESAHEG